jgi:hypothetical protein
MEAEICKDCGKEIPNGVWRRYIDDVDENNISKRVVIHYGDCPKVD